MPEDVCAYRTALVPPKGKKKPHRYATKVSTAMKVERRCSGCWKLEPDRGGRGVPFPDSRVDRPGVVPAPGPGASTSPSLLTDRLGGDGDSGPTHPPATGP